MVKNLVIPGRTCLSIQNIQHKLVIRILRLFSNEYSIIKIFNRFFLYNYDSDCKKLQLCSVVNFDYSNLIMCCVFAYILHFLET